MSDESPTPRLFDHALRVFEEMMKQSRREVTAENVAEGDPVEVIVYEGHLTRLFAELGIANPYYTKIKNALVGQNCIEQLRRGGGVATSKWILHEPPIEETFKEITERKRRSNSSQAILEQRLRDLTRQVSQQQETLDALVDRIGRLEAA